MLRGIITYIFLYGYIFSILLGIHLNVELLDHMVTFSGTAKPFSKVSTTSHSHQQYLYLNSVYISVNIYKIFISLSILLIYPAVWRVWPHLCDTIDDYLAAVSYETSQSNSDFLNLIIILK